MPRRHVPWIAVRIDLPDSAKLADLPSDSARWGWVNALAKAKTQKNLGVFESERHWREVMGRFGRYLSDYVSAGLIEKAGALCNRCQDSHSGLKAGALVIHDYRREQRDPTASTRQQRFREAHENDGESNGVDNAESNGEKTVDSRALSQSLSEDHQETGERGRGSGGNQPTGFDDDPEGPALSWLARHGCYFTSPNDKRLRDLITLVEKRGSDRVIAVFEQLASRGMEDGDVGGYVYRASDAFRVRPSVSVADDEDIERRRVETAERTARLIEERQSVKQPDEAEVRAGMEQLAAAVGRPSRGG